MFQPGTLGPVLGWGHRAGEEEELDLRRQFDGAAGAQGGGICPQRPLPLGAGASAVSRSDLSDPLGGAPRSRVVPGRPSGARRELGPAWPCRSRLASRPAVPAPGEGAARCPTCAQRVVRRSHGGGVGPTGARGAEALGTGEESRVLSRGALQSRRAGSRSRCDRAPPPPPAPPPSPPPQLFPALTSCLAISKAHCSRVPIPAPQPCGGAGETRVPQAGAWGGVPGCRDSQRPPRAPFQSASGPPAGPAAELADVCCPAPAAKQLLISLKTWLQSRVTYGHSSRPESGRNFPPRTGLG